MTAGTVPILPYPTSRDGASPLFSNHVRELTAGPQSKSCLWFRQDGHAYLLPDEHLIAIVGAEHVQRLSGPVEGWAGVLSIRGAMVPVLDAAQLTRHKGPGLDGHGETAVLLLRLPSGPLGLAVEHLEGIRPVLNQSLHQSPWGPGLLGGTVVNGEVVLILDSNYLDALRQLAVAPTESGRRSPQPVQWLDPVTNPVSGRSDHHDLPAVVSSRFAEGIDGGSLGPIGVGIPVVVMGERAADDLASGLERNLAMPVSCVRAVGRSELARPGPPGAPGLGGYRAWGARALPVVDPVGFGIASPSISRGEASYILVLSSGVALLTARVRGVQGLARVEGDTPPGGLVLALGETRGRRAGEQIGVGRADPSYEMGSGARVAVIDPFRLAALLAHPPGHVRSSTDF